MSNSNEQTAADVLVIGGGLAGTWAAIGAAREGASVILADKGYCGTSGVAASGGPGHWWVAPEEREAAIEKRQQASRFGLSERAWMRRIMEETWEQLPTMEGYYAFHTDANGQKHYRGLRGPEYLRALRARCIALGVRILDQSPAVELLMHNDGAVAGARLYQRQRRRNLDVRAAGVVVATGGCAFMSGLLGSQTNTGDGYLMAAEAGAVFSGMEFSSQYCVAPAHTTMTRTMIYTFADYFDGDGKQLDITFFGNMDRQLAAELLKGPVYCNLQRLPEDIRAALPSISPNVPLPFNRMGIDPYKDRFGVTLHAEGTIRGVGGIDIYGTQCETNVPGLYAAGDAASRERVAGAISGGGSINASWALSSGIWSGRAVAKRAKAQGHRSRETAGGAAQQGLPSTQANAVDAKQLVASVQAEMLPYEKNIFRSGDKLRASLNKLDDTWRALQDGVAGADTQKTREATALIATARWCYSAALAREESRGQHQREDFPTTNPALAHRLQVGGLDHVWTRAEQEPVQ